MSKIAGGNVHRYYNHKEIMLRKEGEEACREVVDQTPLQVPVLLGCQYLVRGHPSPHIIPEKHGNIQV